MRLYESVCILRPSQTDEETAEVVEKMRSTLERGGATVLKVENSGKKRLAYEIQHERRGTYITFQFRADGKVLGELERFHRMEDAVMKFMTVRLPHDHLETQLTAAEMESQDGRVQ